MVKVITMIAQWLRCWATDKKVSSNPRTITFGTLSKVHNPRLLQCVNKINVILDKGVFHML